MNKVAIPSTLGQANILVQDKVTPSHVTTASNAIGQAALPTAQ